jgi:hypothetical protein
MSHHQLPHCQQMERMGVRCQLGGQLGQTSVGRNARRVHLALLPSGSLLSVWVAEPVQERHNAQLSALVKVCMGGERHNALVQVHMGGERHNAQLSALAKVHMGRDR